MIKTKYITEIALWLIGFFLLLLNQFIIESIHLVVGLLLFISFNLIYWRTCRDKGFHLNNIAHILPALYIIYAIIYPIGYLFEKIQYFNVSDNSVFQGFQLQAFTIIFLWLGLSLFCKTFDTNEFNTNFQLSLKKIINKLMRINPLLIYFTILIGSLSYSFNIYRKIGFGLYFSRYSNRIQLLKIIDESQWWQIKYIMISLTFLWIFYMTGIFLYKIKQSLIINLLNCYVSFFLGSFWIVNILLGNRRELLYVILFIIFLFSTIKKESRLNIKWIFIVLIIGSLFISSGIYRQKGSSLNFKVANLLQSTLGEFFYPYQTLAYHINYTNKYLYGLSYLNIFSYFVPRQLWEEKPTSLGIQFVKLSKPWNPDGMGYAFMPITEAYLNFGFFSPIFLGFGLALTAALLIKSVKYIPLLYFIICTEIFNINRGEFSGILMEVLIFWVSFWSIILLSNILTLKNNNKKTI